MPTIKIVGWIFGGLATLIGFYTMQIKDAKRMMLFYVALCAVFGLHYLCLGATTGFVMNMVGALRNLFYYFGYRVKRLQHAAIPVFFTAVAGILGFVFRENSYAFLMIAGLVINSFCLSFKNTQNIRKSILVTSPMVLAYNCFVGSIFGAFYESVAILAAIIGIVKYRKQA